jgi:hypothetical protein
MDLHELAAERSLAYHHEIAHRLIQDSTILERARERVRQWEEENPQRPFVRAWTKVLEGTAESVAAFLVDRSELARELRQSSPFAGVLTPQERWHIWRETGEAFASQP